jgi:uncharacterized protein (TIRG00374 family)
VTDHAPATDEPDEAELTSGAAAGRPSRKRLIITMVLGTIVMVGIFVVVLPQLGDYNEAFEELAKMPFYWVAAIVVAGLINIFIYPYTVLVSVPGLRYWHGFIERQVGFLISAGIPGGGAFAVAAQYKILNFYKVAPARSAAAVSADAVWVYLLTLSMPALAIGLLFIEGRNTVGYATIALLGALVVVISIVVIVIVIRNEAGAVRVGNFAHKIIAPVARRFHKEPPNTVEALVEFREHAYDLVTTRWKAITVANTAAQLTPFLVLVTSLAALGAFPGSLTLIEIFAAYSIALLLVSIPISPGGLGTVDLALVTILTAFGCDPEIALAADLLWRLVWFVPQILTGVGSMFAFFVQQRRATAELSA